MTARVLLERDGDVAVVVIDNPPINAGSAKVRRKLLEAIDSVARDDSIVAAVADRRRHDLHRRIGHSGVRSAARRATASRRDRRDRSVPQAVRRRIARCRARWRVRAGARMRCTRRRRRHAGRVAGGDAGHHSRCRRHAAVAAPRRRSARDPDGLQRRARLERRCAGRRPDRRGGEWRPAQRGREPCAHARRHQEAIARSHGASGERRRGCRCRCRRLESRQEPTRRAGRDRGGDGVQPASDRRCAGRRARGVSATARVARSRSASPPVLRRTRKREAPSSRGGDTSQGRSHRRHRGGNDGLWHRHRCPRCRLRRAAAGTGRCGAGAWSEPDPRALRRAACAPER